MGKAVFTLIALLCLTAAPHTSGTTRQKTGGSPHADAASVSEAVGLLVSRLKGVGEVRVPATNSAVRVSSVRAEGCTLRYNLTSERAATYGPGHSNRPQVSTEEYIRTVHEWTVNLAGLDPAGVQVGNPLQLKKGGSVAFSAAGDTEAISLRWQVNSRAGVRMRTDRPRSGRLPADDEGSLEGVAAALRRAIEVCRTPAS